MAEFVTLPDIEGFDTFTGGDEWHAVYTIQLSELINDGILDWHGDMLDWSGAAYDDRQFARLCEAFEGRFMWREISMLPFSRWAQQVRYRLVYELMPKYRPLYEAVEEGYNPLADYDEYYKRRSIDSDYPETLLSKNADYISSGNDTEEERLRIANVAEQAAVYAKGFKAVDTLILDELDSLFISMYSYNVNGW